MNPWITGRIIEQIHVDARNRACDERVARKAGRRTRRGISGEDRGSGRR